MLTKEFTFWMWCTQICDKYSVEAKNEMVQNAQTVTRDTFVRNCKGARKLFIELDNMMDDPTTSFHKSKILGVDCYYLNYAGFEIVFIKDGPLPVNSIVKFHYANVE